MERIIGTIPAIVGSLEGGPEADRALVLARWREVAGGLVGEATKAIEYIDKRLVVAVADTTWKRHLEELAPEILARLNRGACSGLVSYIVFQSAPGKLTARTEKKKTRSTPTAVPVRVEAAALRISDEALRRQFLDAAAVYLDPK